MYRYIFFASSCFKSFKVKIRLRNVIFTFVDTDLDGCLSYFLNTFFVGNVGVSGFDIKCHK